MNRYRLSNEERNELVRAQLDKVIKASPHGERTTFELVCERILDTRDDLARRTNGKQKTWATHQKNGNELTRATRLKQVGAAIGAILCYQNRRSRTWVLDAIEDGVQFVPWKAVTA